MILARGHAITQGFRCGYDIKEALLQNNRMTNPNQVYQKYQKGKKSNIIQCKFGF